MVRNEHLGHRLDNLKTLRDEIVVKVHLAEMDVRDRWEALRPRIDEVELQAERASDATVDALIRSVDSISESLHELKTKIESKMTH
ncbi:MAG: hypothetical protein WCJ30_04510 [Deltaproteobacteria bacterium]